MITSWDGSFRQILIDSVNVFTGSEKATGPSRLADKSTFCIGRAYGGDSAYGGEYFSGKIRGVRIWDRAVVVGPCLRWSWTHTEMDVWSADGVEPPTSPPSRVPPPCSLSPQQPRLMVGGSTPSGRRYSCLLYTSDAADICSV